MNQLDLKGRNAVITGGAQGIGFSIAQRMLSSGASVVLWDRNRDALEAAKSALGAGAAVRTVTVELGEESSVQAAARSTLEHAGVDILVNNAGITGGNGTVWELDSQVWQDVIHINLIAPFFVCKALVPSMIERGYGRIVNIASIAGKEGNPNASHYSASKAGLIALTKSLGKELANKGIMVNAVAPAAAKTPLFDTMKPEFIDYMLSKIPMGRFVLVEEIAAMACWLASEDCSFTTGAVFDISGGRGTY